MMRTTPRSDAAPFDTSFVSAARRRLRGLSRRRVAQPPCAGSGEWLFFGFLQAENFEAATVAPGQTHRRIAASASWSRLKRRRMDALQETPRSPQEQPLIHTDEESATETTQMDVQTWSPQGAEGAMHVSALQQRRAAIDDARRGDPGDPALWRG
ncbi:hypothetical protein MRX96_039013 [Rhipicephalus microplus]